MFDLEIQPADIPGKQPIAPAVVHRGLNLVHCPGSFHSAGVCLRHGKGGFLHAVRQLEHHAQCNSLDERDRNIKRQHRQTECTSNGIPIASEQNNALPPMKVAKSQPLGRGCRSPPKRPMATSRKSS